MGEHGQVKADWYPDPHGGPGVRWWDGERWTDDVRDEHPRAGWAEPAPPAAPPPAAPASSSWGGSDPWGTRLVVTQLRPRQVEGPAYVVRDAQGLHLGTVFERPVIAGRWEERAATLDMYDDEGGAVYRLTRDPSLVGPICASLGWPPLRPWGYVVLGPDTAPVAVAQSPTWSHKAWEVRCLGIDAPLVLRDQRIGTGRKAPRPVVMGGAVVAQITLVSGWGSPDAYVLDLFHGPPEGALATLFAALVPMYDQIFREVTPSSSGGSVGSSD